MRSDPKREVALGGATGVRKEGRVLALLGTVLIVGCGAGSGPAGDAALLGDGRSRGLRLEVQNQSYFDAELHALMGTARQRLGIVSGNATEHFAFAWPPDRGLRIEIELKLIGFYLTDPLPVEEGDDLLLIIEPSLHLQEPVRRR